MARTDDFGVDVADEAIDMGDYEGLSLDDDGGARTRPARGTGGIVPRPVDGIPSKHTGDVGGRISIAGRIKRSQGLGETVSRELDNGKRPVRPTSGSDTSGARGDSAPATTETGLRSSNNDGRTRLAVGGAIARKAAVHQAEFTRVTFQCTVKDVRHITDGSMVVQFVIPYSDVDAAIDIRHAYHKMVLCTIERKGLAEDG